MEKTILDLLKEAYEALNNQERLCANELFVLNFLKMYLDIYAVKHSNRGIIKNKIADFVRDIDSKIKDKFKIFYELEKKVCS